MPVRHIHAFELRLTRDNCYCIILNARAAHRLLQFLTLLHERTVCRRFFAEQIAQRNLIAIIMSQSPEYVAPHGSNEAIFGTNPIAVGIPSADGAPIVIDVATSAVAWYDLVDARSAGRSVAADVGYDAAGEPSRDPDAILQGGALRVFDRCSPG